MNDGKEEQNPLPQTLTVPSESITSLTLMDEDIQAVNYEISFW
jgi:hypothetical protein